MNKPHSETVLKVKGLNVPLNPRAGTAGRCVRIEHLEVPRGRTTVILGPSGSGKSTLLFAMSGLIQVGSAGGEVTLLTREGVDLNVQGMSGRNAVERFAFVLQGNDLIPEVSARLNIEATAVAKGVARAKKQAQYLQVGSLEETDQLNREAWTFSGGERQAIAMSRELLSDPEILFADEPGSNLDHAHRIVLLRHMKQVALEVGATLVIVTHDPAIADEFGDIFVVIETEEEDACTFTRKQWDDPQTREIIHRMAGFSEQARDRVAIGALEKGNQGLSTFVQRLDFSCRLGLTLAMSRATSRFQVPRRGILPQVFLVTMMMLAMMAGSLGSHMITDHFVDEMNHPDIAKLIVNHKTVPGENPRKRLTLDDLRLLDTRPWAVQPDPPPEGLSSYLRCQGLRTAFPYVIQETWLELNDTSEPLTLLAACPVDTRVSDMLEEKRALLYQGPRYDRVATTLNVTSDNRKYSRLLVNNSAYTAGRSDFFSASGTSEKVERVRLDLVGNAKSSVLDDEILSLELTSSIPSPEPRRPDVFLPLEVLDRYSSEVVSLNGIQVYFDASERVVVREWFEMAHTAKNGEGEYTYYYIGNFANFDIMEQLALRLSDNIAALGYGKWIVIGFVVLALVAMMSLAFATNRKAFLLLRLRGLSALWIIAIFSVFVLVICVWSVAVAAGLAVSTWLLISQGLVAAPDVMPEWPVLGANFLEAVLWTVVISQVCVLLVVIAGLQGHLSFAKLLRRET